MIKLEISWEEVKSLLEDFSLNRCGWGYDFCCGEDWVVITQTSYGVAAAWTAQLILTKDKENHVYILCIPPEGVTVQEPIEDVLMFLKVLKNYEPDFHEKIKASLN